MPSRAIKTIEINAIEVAPQRRGMSSGKLAHAFPKARLGAVFHGKVFEEPVQVFGEIPGAGVAASRVECQAFGDERVEAPGNLRDIGAVSEGTWRRLAIMSSIDSSSEPPGGDLGKSGLAGEHLEQDQPQGVDVGSLVDGLGRRRPPRD